MLHAARYIYVTISSYHITYILAHTSAKAHYIL